MLRQTIRIDPGHYRARNNLAAILYQEGDVEGAVRQYRQAISIKPDFAGPRFGLATLLMEQGDRAGAVEHFREIVRAGDDDYLQRFAYKMLQSMGESPGAPLRVPSPPALPPPSAADSGSPAPR
jgi:Flp pilus assembly protein TadD